MKVSFFHKDSGVPPEFRSKVICFQVEKMVLLLLLLITPGSSWVRCH